MVAIGQRIGNFRVVRKLGQGGMGAVFEAVQEEIGRRAAIKVLLQQFGTDQQSILRFINEARAVNIIQHPGLVGIFESGRLDDGAAYIVMEYLDGELLGGRLRRLRALDQPMALNLGRQIASALAAAHQKGIIHRDLKPDNIMIVADPEILGGERIKVFDFGLAKLWSSSPAPDIAPDLAAPGMFRTKSGAVLGTPTHMSPEQCRGNTEIDGKADVYALGVILFEMLAGHPPFMAPSAGELISMHLRDKPPSLRKLEKSVPAPLADLVAAMLKKDPAERPDMATVVQELEALGANRRAQSSPAHTSKSRAEEAELAVAQTLAAPPSVPAPVTTRPLTRSDPRRQLLALGLVALLIAAGAVAWRIKRAPRESVKTAEATVTWLIDSEPSGAEIFRDDGEVVGTTPWSRTEPPRDGLLRLHLRLPQHRDSIVLINQTQNSDQKVLLEREAKTEGPTPITAGDQRPQQRLRWTVASQPPGAEVILADDEQIVGKTPWTLEQGAHEGILKLFLQLPGYVRTSVLLDLSAGSQQTIILQRSGEKPRTPKPPPPGTRPPGPPEATPFSPVY